MKYEGSIELSENLITTSMVVGGTSDDDDNDTDRSNRIIVARASSGRRRRGEKEIQNVKMNVKKGIVTQLDGGADQ